VFNKPCHPTSVHCLLIRRFFPDSPTTEPSLLPASASADFQVLLITPSHQANFDIKAPRVRASEAMDDGFDVMICVKSFNYLNKHIKLFNLASYVLILPDIHFSQLHANEIEK